MSDGATRMRIVYVAYGLISPMKAHNLQTVYTVNALAARGHDVKFVNPRLPADRAARDVNLPRCETVLLRAGGLFELHRSLTARGRFWSLFADRSIYALRALRHVRTARPDVVVTRDLVVCFWLLVSRFYTRAPVVYELHSLEQVMFDAGDDDDVRVDADLLRRVRALAATDFAGHQNDSSRLGELYKRFVRRLEDATLRRVPLVLTLTDATAQRLEREHSVRLCRTLPSGQAFGPRAADDTTALRRRLGLPLGRNLAVYAGLSLNGKGIELLFVAAAHLTSDCAIVVIGADRAHCTALEALRDERGLHSRIIFVPRVEHRVVRDYLQACDLGLLVYPPTRAFAEFASPLKLVEYLACGLPVVASRLPSIEEIVRDGVNGRVVPPGDARAAAAAIDELLGDEALVARLAAGARSAATEYAYERRAERIEDALCIST